MCLQVAFLYHFSVVSEEVRDFLVCWSQPMENRADSHTNHDTSTAYPVPNINSPLLELREVSVANEAVIARVIRCGGIL